MKRKLECEFQEALCYVCTTLVCSFLDTVDRYIRHIPRLGMLGTTIGNYISLCGTKSRVISARLVCYG